MDLTDAVEKRFLGGLQTTLIQSKQQTRNFDSESRLPRFDYCAPPALRELQHGNQALMPVRSRTIFAKVRRPAIIAASSLALVVGLF
jgi:hypothetical protein